MKIKGSGNIQILFASDFGFKKGDVIINQSSKQYLVKKVFRMTWWRKILCKFSNRFYVQNKAILTEVKEKS
jgi:hypothetical protein